MEELLKMVTATMGLLSTNENGTYKQKRRNIKKAWKYYKKIKRQLKKGEYTPDEKIQVMDMMDALIKAQIELLS